jgi:hypothetical protein
MKTSAMKIKLLLVVGCGLFSLNSFFFQQARAAGNRLALPARDRTVSEL